HRLRRAAAGRLVRPGPSRVLLRRPLGVVRRTARHPATGTGPLLTARAPVVVLRPHEVDEPVVLLAVGPPAGVDEGEAARAPRTVRTGEPPVGPAGEGDDDLLALAPLLEGVGAVVPDGHLPGAVLSCGDRAGEGEVLHRVVLGLDRQMVLLRRRR